MDSHVGRACLPMLFGSYLIDRYRHNYPTIWWLSDLRLTGRVASFTADAFNDSLYRGFAVECYLPGKRVFELPRECQPVFFWRRCERTETADGCLPWSLRSVDGLQEHVIFVGFVFYGFSSFSPVYSPWS